MSKDKKPKPEKPVEQGKPKSETEESPDFVHMVRLAGVVVDGKLTVEKSLTKLKGIGRRLAEALILNIDMPTDARIGSLSEADIAKLEGHIEQVSATLPPWMLNHRKNMNTGTDMHFVGPDLDMQIREDVNLIKRIKTYKGVRHILNLPVRGQRTRSSFRKGSTVGVSRKKRG